MEQELVKQAFKLGNSAGVLLPIEWKDKKVKIQLVEKTITKDIIEILEDKNILKNTLGIFLAGSYARGEETESSDIDILVITDEINKQIKLRGYEIVLISLDKLNKNIKNNLYLASLIHESKAITNDQLLKDLKKQIINLSIKKSLEEIKRMIKINEGFIDIDKKTDKNVLDENIYSIILRLRELYLMDCLKNNKNYSNKDLINLIMKITGSLEPYESYLRIKNDKRSRQTIPPAQAKKIIEEMKKMVKILEHGKKR